MTRALGVLLVALAAFAIGVAASADPPNPHGSPDSGALMTKTVRSAPSCRSAASWLTAVWILLRSTSSSPVSWTWPNRPSRARSSPTSSHELHHLAPKHRIW